MGRFAVLFVSVLQLAGCATYQRSVLEKGAWYGDLVAFEEAQSAAGATTDALYKLCNAYSKTKNYAKLFACADKLEQRVARGDTAVTYLGAVGTIDGSLMPHLLRARAYIELSQYEAAVAEADKAMLQLVNVRNPKEMPLFGGAERE